MRFAPCLRNMARWTVSTLSPTGTPGVPEAFGFVEMSVAAEADAAIAALNGRELDGRALNVNEARPKEDRGGGGGGYRGGGGGGRQNKRW